MSPSRTILPAVLTALVTFIPMSPVLAQIGECFGEGCTGSCPSEFACETTNDCPDGWYCRRACLPQTCHCFDKANQWACLPSVCLGECIIPPAEPPKYAIIDLGILGGGSSVALAINSVGQVAGGADRADGLRHAFLWDAGQMTDLGTLPPWFQIEAWDINNHGDVIGIATNGGTVTSAFLWQNGSLLDIGHITGNDSGNTSAYGINDAGQIVGGSLANGAMRVFIWEDGTFTEITNTIGGDGGGALDINAHSVVVGGASAGQTPGGAFAWDNGQMNNLGTLGGELSWAQSVNDDGQIVGSSDILPGWQFGAVAFLWEHGQMTNLWDIGVKRGVSAEQADAINNPGQIVGRRFFYDPHDGMQDPDELIPYDSGWYDLDPRDINDRGQIVGDGRSPDGLHAFLMTPIDADFDDDDDTDLLDLGAFQLCFGNVVSAGGPCEQCDIDRNGVVEREDYHLLHWHLTGPKGLCNDRLPLEVGALQNGAV